MCSCTPLPGSRRAQHVLWVGVEGGSLQHEQERAFFVAEMGFRDRGDTYQVPLHLLAAGADRSTAACNPVTGCAIIEWSRARLRKVSEP